MRDTIKYKRAVIFSGGGSRFAIYGGIFSAMKDFGYTPDLIIGSCGGAIAASIITAFNTSNEIKEYMKSEEVYNFAKSLKLTKEKMLYRIGIDYKLRKIRNKKNIYIEDVFNKFIVEIPENLEEYLPSLNKTQKSSISTIVIGAKMLFEKSEVGKKCIDRKLYKKILFTDGKTAKMIDENILTTKSNIFLESVISKKSEVITDIPKLKAARISISDMFYTNPVYYNGEYFSGGAIDLVPVELAKYLAEEVFLELKQEYNKVADSSVKSVFGYSGNERLKEISDLYADYWVDTSDVPLVLKGHYITAKINPFKLQVGLSVPNSYEKFVEDVEIQWEYGYERLKEALSNEKNNRVKNRE